jgi:NADPH-dependent glutamate synthase beta subunit-like oxidoreductase
MLLTVQELFEAGHDAGFVTIGAQKSFRLNVPGEDLSGVEDAPGG